MHQGDIGKIHIAVTGLNATDNPGPGIAVIRAIRNCPDFEVYIIGLSYESLEPGIYMHTIINKTYQLPYPTAGTESLYNRLKYIHEKERIDMIIPNFDAELYNFIKLESRLKKLGIHSYLPTEQQLIARDKPNLQAFGNKFNFKIPTTELIHKVTELNDCYKTLDFPMVLKGKFYDATIVNSLDEAEKVFYKIQAKWGLPIIAQKYIEGTEINIAVLGDGKGLALSLVPMRKLYITDKGKAWAGITIESEELESLGKQFVKATNWKGSCELEIIRSTNGDCYILEVNPRFPAWIYLTEAAGQNQPAMLVKLAMNMPVEAVKKYEIGKMFIRYAWELITDVAEFQQISGKGEL